MTSEEFISGDYDKKRTTVEQFCFGFDPIDFEIECLISREMTPEEWERENEVPFSD